MSASDAAPLPRLGEVFFDVRGSSRSMRLSWYADTGVAVFSIWQGGMCTGTFRLPIGDLPRMVEILQRGPAGTGHPGLEQPAGRPGPGAYTGPQDYPTGTVLAEGQEAGYPAEPRPGYGRDGYAEPPGGYGRDELASTRRAPAYGRDEPAEATRAMYGRGEPQEPTRPAYARDELAEARQAVYQRDDAAGPPPRAGSAPGAGPGPAGYGRDEYPPAGGGRRRDAFSDGPYPGYRPEPLPDTGRAGHGRDPGAESTTASYGQDRFVPPYVPGPASEYENDIPVRAAEVPAGTRRNAYRGERPGGRSDDEDYPERQWPPADYSQQPRYR
jgi:hypothetical protein